MPGERKEGQSKLRRNTMCTKVNNDLAELCCVTFGRFEEADGVGVVVDDVRVGGQARHSRHEVLPEVHRQVFTQRQVS